MSQCGIVVETAADVVVAAFGQGLILVECAAGLELRCRQVEDALAGAGRDHVHEAEQVLVRIAEAQAASDARFVKRGRARHVEGGHALVGVPDVDHAVGVQVGRFHLIDIQQAVPIFPQRLEGRGDVFAVEIFGDDRLDGFLVDRLRIGRVELFVHRVLVVAQNENDLLGFARLEVHFDVVRADAGPSRGRLS